MPERPEGTKLHHRSFRPGFILRRRKPHELFWSEIIAFLLVLALLLLILMSSLHMNDSSNGKNDESKKVVVQVEIESEEGFSHAGFGLLDSKQAIAS